MHSVVFDTNVLISIALFGGRLESLLELWIDKQFNVYVSDKLILEFTDKLENKFHKPKSLQIRWANFLNKYAISVPVIMKSAKVCRDKDDNYLLDLSVSSKSDFLVTGDNDLLVLKEYQGVQIIKPAEFLNSIINQTK